MWTCGRLTIHNAFSKKQKNTIHNALVLNAFADVYVCFVFSFFICFYLG